MLLLVFHPVLARSILVKGMELLEKMHLMRYKSTRIEKLNASMDQYHTTAVYLKDHIMVLVNVFAITLFQRFALFTATWFVSCRTNGWKIYRNLVRKAGGENGK